MSKSTSRRAILAGIAIAPAAALTAPAAALGTSSPAQDVELRRLWSEYLTRADAHAVAQERYKPVRAVFEAELPPCPDDVVFGDHWFAHNWLWRKHGLDQLSDAWNDAGSAMSETVEAILQTEAAGLFGIGVKLAALPDKPDPEDYEDAIAAVLNDIDRLLGSDFAARVASLMEHDLESDESPNDSGGKTVAA